MNRKLAVSLILVLVVAAPLVLKGSSWGFVIHILGSMGLYMLLAMGLNIVIGQVGLLDLGFMAFYAWGAYTAALLSLRGWNFWLVLPVTILVTVMIRLLLGAPVLRLRGDYLAIVTLGFGEITRIFLNNWDAVTNGPKGLSLLSSELVRPIQFFLWPVTEDFHFYYLILGFVLVGIEVSRRLEHSRVGRAWVAIREDELAAEQTGVGVTKMKMLAFALSAVYAGAAGAIFARWERFVTPESFTFWESALLVVMVVIGGMGSVPGVLLGVALVVGIPEVLRNLLGGFINYRYLLFGVALVFVAIYRPQGLFPSRRRELELLGSSEETA